MSEVRELKQSDFQKEVINSETPVLVDFFAPWCGPCKALAPILKETAATFADRLKVVKLNVDEAQELAVKYGIRGVPTIMLFKAGKIVETMVGLPQANALRAKLEAFTAMPAKCCSCGCGCGA